MTDIEINGETYELTDDPSMRTVKDVQQMQMSMLRNHLGEEAIRGMDGLGEDDLVDAILDNHGFEGLKDMLWSRSLMDSVQTISLAADEVFAEEDFEDMGAREFQSIQEAAEEALGGDADDFFDELNVGMSLNKSEIEEARAQA